MFLVLSWSKILLITPFPGAAFIDQFLGGHERTLLRMRLTPAPKSNFPLFSLYSTRNCTGKGHLYMIPFLPSISLNTVLA